MKGLAEMLDSVIYQRYDSDKLLILHTKKARFTFDKPLPWTRDGEAGGAYQQIELCNHAHAIEMIF